MLTTALLLLWAALALPAAGQPHFTDQTQAAGINYTNVFGGAEKTYILESHGSGAAFFDWDNDGHLDLYIANGATFATYADQSGPGNVLYHNRGDGTFADITAQSGGGDASWSAGVAVGDIDNDGFRDLYVTNYGANILYRNQGGQTLVPTAAGVAGDQYSASAAFFDSDNDGDLDLYVTNYVEFDLAQMPDDADQAKRCVFLGGIQVYCGPKGMVGAPDVLYRNRGDGTFEDITLPSGIAQANRYYGLGVVPLDWDGDGDQDLYVANDETPNVLFDNRGDNTFEDIALLAGLAYNSDGDEEAGMGVDAGDYDGDGDYDLYVTNFFRETNTLYRNEGGNFTDRTTPTGLGAPTINLLGWGTRFLDYDSDGELDLFVANGHVYPQVDQVPTGSSYRQPNQLFRNLGDGRFADFSAQAGPGLTLAKVSRGACSGDYDNDGDMDLFVVNLDDNATLLRNDGGDNNWLKVQLFGRADNRDGLGSKLRLTVAGQSRWAAVNGAGSYLSHSDTRVHFGLGSHSVAEQLELVWPDGSRQLIRDLPANKLVAVEQGGGHRFLDLHTSPYP